jgi:hypothetical protein
MFGDVQKQIASSPGAVYASASAPRNDKYLEKE